MQLNRKQFIIVIYLLSLLSQIECVTEVLRPKGVPLSKKVFYDPTKEFQCLDGSNTLPFILVNDDYCDCDDGSDEPGTNACPNGRFHCSNIGYIESIIPSSRVNDGICDCCDASDEYNSSAQCPNNCMELGQQLREEREKHLRLLKEGNQIREQYIEEARKKKQFSKQQLEELRKQKSQVEEEKNAREANKKDAEEKEKAALDRYKEEEDKLKKQKEEEEILRSQEEDRKLADIAFKEMDLNRDNVLSYTEVQKFTKFDKDGDGVVSEEEAKFYLHAANEMEFEEFVESGWIIMKPYYLKDKTQHDLDGTQEYNKEEAKPLESESNDANLPENSADSQTEHEVEHESPQNDEESPSDTPTEDTEPANEEDEEEDNEPPPFFPPRDAELLETTTPSQEPASPQYDEETKQLIENAKRARDEYSEVEGKFLDMQTKIRELEVNLETDYGPSDEFMPLHGQCFEFTDREYTYKLCPFDSASQRPKSGGTETSLGRWGKWIGPEFNKYQKMMFDGGATCWNGPARSVAVNVKCGVVNEVTAASEPSRCEYELNFSTPAICVTTSQSEDHEHVHTEL